MFETLKHNIHLLLFFLSLISCGLFHEFVSAFFSVLIFITIVYDIFKNKKLILKINRVAISVFSITAAYLVCSIWAIDSGMAILGFVKFLPLPLFYVSFMQKPEEKEKLFKYLPAFAAITTTVSAVLMQVPVIKRYFSVAGRLSGFFQYSNTFALFLLVCLILAVTGKTQFKKTDFLYIVIIIGGILYSGSRTVMLLTVLSVAVLLVFLPQKRIKIAVISIFAAMAAAAVIYAVISGNFDNVGRFLKTSFTESTFLGRLLYYKDGLRVIAKHPFGLGYLGYYFCEQSIQTGFYSVRYIHNDFLQLMLDVGWLPAAGFIYVILRSFFSRGAGLRKRLLIFVIAAHASFDFDLQFVSVFVLFILILDDKGGKVIEIKSIAKTTVIIAFAAILQLYFGIVLLFSYLELNTLALRLYPYNTEVRTKLLTEEINNEKMNEMADRILEQNEYVSIAYSAKARYAYSVGDFGKVISYKKAVFKYAPYQIEDYNEYCRMLIIGIQLYEQNGDIDSAGYCKNELLKVPEILKSVEEKTDKLAFRLTDKPQLTLDDEILNYITLYQNEEAEK